MIPLYTPYHVQNKPPGVDGAERPRFDLASPYGPYVTQEGDSDNIYAKALVDQLRGAYEKTYDANPGLFNGLVVFGSTVKGLAHARSDVDCYLLYDPAFSNPDEPDKNAARIAHGKTYNMAFTCNTHLRIAGLTVEPKASIHLSPASEKSLQTEIEIFSDRYANTDSDLRTLFVPFMLQVGPGIVRSLRKVILDKLDTLPDGDAYFKEIMRQLKVFEEVHRNAEFQLPDTTAEARVYFRTDPKSTNLGTIALQGKDQ